MKIPAVVALLALTLKSANAKKSHYLKQAGGHRPTRVTTTYDGTECLVENDAETFLYCISHAVDWQIGFEWTQESSTEFIDADNEFYDYFKFALSLYTEQELNVKPYLDLLMDFFDEDTDTEYYTETQFAFGQFKASVFAQLVTWEPLVLCGNVGYVVKDILF